MEDPSEVAIAEVCDFANLDPIDDRNIVIAALKVGCSRGALRRCFLASRRPAVVASQMGRSASRTGRCARQERLIEA